MFPCIVTCLPYVTGKGISMKKTAWFGLFMMIAFAAYPVCAAEGPTYMEQIQARNTIIAEATERINKDKEDIDAYYARGSAHRELGQLYILMYGGVSTDQNPVIKTEFEAAVTDLTAAIDLKPDLVNAYLSRGMAYGQLGLSAAAIADFTRVINIDPKNSGAYYARGREYWEAGDYLKAKEDYDKAVELDPQWKNNFYR
jgi:tetratricopeptide (TPR) repeat protein